MSAELPITRRAPRFIFAINAINTILLLIAVARGARIASIALALALFGTTLLYAASVRAARNDQPNQLKRYMNTALFVTTLAVFLFLTGR
jgi:hypothetical protein